MNAATKSTTAHIDTTFTRFADFQPTYLDAKGVGTTEDDADWLVVPLTYHPKTAGLLETSNWKSALASLEEVDPECNDHTTHLFGHWATDFEIIAVRPGSAAHIEAERLAAALAHYPVLDEIDLSNREYEAQWDAIADALRQLTVEDDGVDVGDGQLFTEVVFEDMWENDQGALECSEEGCWISREQIEACLERLGYVYCEDEMAWRPEGETGPAVS
jgi:hypothetical protein